MEKLLIEPFNNLEKETSSEFDNSKTEMEFCTFYVNILNRLYQLSDRNSSKIRNSLRNIRSYKNPDIEEHEIVSFEENSDRLAYIFAYSVINSIIMYDRFSSMLKFNPSMAEKITSMKKIKLCVLGGGPAFEVVSICKVLEEILTRNKNAERPPLIIYVTVVDICIGWKKDVELIMTSAQNKLCDPKTVQIRFDFIEADLTTNFTEDVKMALISSHFVTMFKFVSDVNDASYSEREVPVMVQRIIEAMNFRACLFFLDTSGGGLFKKMDRMIDRHPYTARIYGPSLYNTHFLCLDSVEDFSNAVWRIFRYLKCTSQSTISCSVWLKARNVVKATDLFHSTTNTPFNFLENVTDPKLKEKRRKIKIKKVLQSAAKFNALYYSESEKQGDAQYDDLSSSDTEKENEN